MDDLISRQAAIDAMAECYWSIMGDEPPTLDEKTALYVDLKQAVKRLPTANPSVVRMKLKVDAEDVRKAMQDAELTLLPADLSEYCDKLWKTAYERGKAEVHPKKGKWIDYCGGVKCDQCGFECDDTYYLGEANFCPNCGARMGE